MDQYTKTQLLLDHSPHVPCPYCKQETVVIRIPVREGTNSTAAMSFDPTIHQVSIPQNQNEIRGWIAGPYAVRNRELLPGMVYLKAHVDTCLTLKDWYKDGTPAEKKIYMSDYF